MTYSFSLRDLSNLCGSAVRFFYSFSSKESNFEIQANESYSRC
jgi:hypothetical protein